MGDAKLELPIGDHFENRAGPFTKVVGGGNVMRQRRSSQEQRPLLGENYRIKWRHRAAGAPEEHHVSSRTQNVQTLLEGSFSDAVVNHVHAFSFGKPFRFRFKINLRV